MAADSLKSVQLQLWFDRMQAGDGSARDELLRATQDRLEHEPEPHRARDAVSKVFHEPQPQIFHRSLSRSRRGRMVEGYFRSAGRLQQTALTVP